MFCNIARLFFVIFFLFTLQSPCESFPCQNGGTCRPLYTQNGYRCECLDELMERTAKKVIMIIILDLLNANSWPANTAAMRGGCIRRLTNFRFINFKFALHNGSWQSSVYV